ncbi:2,3,4,5-tetrahydropyridine-2,6-dicarboxylate N-succinyltransferase [Paraferrimonas sp. SM1919]|uniref:2,3,4,5-tetrahydropyridine-2,6-dicarboxylate N-succinyltransferase n=1 Tax=Paraferrimonas sp. SM1919 TaxID=2662263 RepID=UPI0013D1E1F8|nr:2,3,4,5-tetrahydropyridine-2,6-dicarboxylate N-succinyltransferase [Paraferrimonas sp. SM1919]
MSVFALALGSATKNKDGKIIEAYFPSPIHNPSQELADAVSQVIGTNQGTVEVSKAHLSALTEIFIKAELVEAAVFAKAAIDSEQPFVVVNLAEDVKPTTVAEGYLKLQLISHRFVQPHGTVLDGIFGLLHNIAWTNQGPIDLPELNDRQLQARLNGEVLTVDCVDKFPKMVDYVVPSGIRIADTSRVRLGAHIAEGTTIMHEGFVNFNAGTLGVSMVEGRISAGVVVGDGTDIGGGASIMGTLSGGNSVVISMGEKCLLGANAGLGIPLGDRCTVEAGLYVTGGSKVEMLDDAGKLVETVKAGSLAGKSDLLFRRHSLTGAIQCLTNKSAIELNSELHSNN